MSVGAEVLAAAVATLTAAGQAEHAALEGDLRVYGVAYYRINVHGQLERLEPMKVQIRQPWDRPRHT